MYLQINFGNVNYTGEGFFVQIQRCIMWKASDLDQIRYDHKLKKKGH
jgi:hypothetical protein